MRPPPTRANVLAILPAQNEEAAVGEVVRGVRRHVDRVLVVDDGSDDATRAIALREGAAVLTLPRSGKGAALRAGFAEAARGGYAWVLTLDADGQHDPDDVPGFLAEARARPLPFFVGTRRGDLETMPLVRRLTNVCMSTLVSRFAQQTIPDSQNGFRLIATDVVRSIRLTTTHFETESELLIAAAWRGFAIGSVPVRTIYRKGGRSHIRKVPDTWRFLRLCASLNRLSRGWSEDESR